MKVKHKISDRLVDYLNYCDGQGIAPFLCNFTADEYPDCWNSELTPAQKRTFAKYRDLFAPTEAEHDAHFCGYDVEDSHPFYSRTHVLGCGSAWWDAGSPQRIIAAFFLLAMLREDGL